MKDIDITLVDRETVFRVSSCRGIRSNLRLGEMVQDRPVGN